MEAWLGRAPPALELIGRRDRRSHNSWLHNLPALAKGKSRADLKVHPDDAARLGLENGQPVGLRSRVGVVEARLAVTDELRPGVVSLPHGYGHDSPFLGVASLLPGPNVNVLTDEEQIEPILGCSILNGVPVEVEHVSSLPAGLRPI